MKKQLITLIIISLCLPILTFSQNQAQEKQEVDPAEIKTISPPETLEEAKEMGEKALETVPKELPGILERIWKEEAMPVWETMWNWSRNYWKNTLWPSLSGYGREKIKPHIDEKKEAIEERVEEEKEELKRKVIPRPIQSLWEKFKELIK